MELGAAPACEAGAGRGAAFLLPQSGGHQTHQLWLLLHPVSSFQKSEAAGLVLDHRPGLAVDSVGSAPAAPPAAGCGGESSPHGLVWSPSQAGSRQGQLPQA